MQLFVTEIKINQDNAFLDSPEIIHQLTKVLRAGLGYQFQVQFLENEKISRYTLQISEIAKTQIICNILIQEEKDISDFEVDFGMILTLPNNFDKLELMIQKLCEIGIPNIGLWASSRSIIKNINEHKFIRLQKIATEAVEQSKSWIMPNIFFLDDIQDFIMDKNLIVFDFGGKENIKMSDKKNIYGIVGPEGGFDEKDFQKISARICEKISLGQNVLRMETASIVGGRLLKN